MCHLVAMWHFWLFACLSSVGIFFYLLGDVYIHYQCFNSSNDCLFFVNWLMASCHSVHCLCEIVINLNIKLLYINHICLTYATSINTISVIASMIVYSLLIVLWHLIKVYIALFMWNCYNDQVTLLPYTPLLRPLEPFYGNWKLTNQQLFSYVSIFII